MAVHRDFGVKNAFGRKWPWKGTFGLKMCFFWPSKMIFGLKMGFWGEWPCKEILWLKMGFGVKNGILEQNARAKGLLGQK